MLILDNKTINKKILKQLIYCAFLNYGKYKATLLADGLKNLGFYFATQSGISISVEDLKVPNKKKYALYFAKKQIIKTNFLSSRGQISEVERFQKVIDTWHLTNESVKDKVVEYFQTHDPLNPIYIMAFSGARGNLSQVRQLVGMRGLMADPNGQIIDLSINHSFREGLSLANYIISSYGARKGIIDTSLKTADSGYLTRRLVDVAQHVIIREIDCKTKRSLRINNMDDITSSLVGRILAKPVIYIPLQKKLANNNQAITERLIKQFAKYHIWNLSVRSSLTCESSRSVCQKCYGWNLAEVNMVTLGESIGIIAAQSIGEPATQLTMRTFHTGGVATNDLNGEIRATQMGQVFFSKKLVVQPSRSIYGEKIFIVKNNSKLYLLNKKLVLHKINLIPGLVLFVKNKVIVKKDQKIAILPVRTNQALIATKKIQSMETGEVFFQKLDSNLIKKNYLKVSNFGLIWIMRSEVFLIKTNSRLRLKTSKKYYLNEILTQTRIIGNHNGVLKTQRKFNLKQKKYKYSKVLTPLSIFNRGSLFKCQTHIKYILLNKNNEIYEFKINFKTSVLKSLNLLKLLGYNYNIFIGSQIFYSTLNKNGIENNGGNCLLLPEEHFILNNENKFLSLNSYKFVYRGYKFSYEEIATSDGLIFMKRKEGILNKLIFQPGQQIPIPDAAISSSDNFNDPTIWQLHSKILYPGELLLNFSLIPQLKYVQVYKRKIRIENYLNNITMFCNDYKTVYVFLRPLSQITLPKLRPIVHAKFTLFEKTHIIKKKRSLNFKSGVWINSRLKNRGELIKQFIQLKLKTEQVTRLKIRVLKSKTPFSIYNVYLLKINGTNLMCNGKKELNANTINNQILEPYTILNYYNSIEQNSFHLLNFKNKENFKNFVFYTNSKHYRMYKFKPSTKILKQKRFIKKKDYLTKSGLSNLSGYILRIQEKTVFIRLGEPYFLAKGSILYIKNGDLITKKMDFALLVYERIISGDIVQGLPRIEQILEARVSSELGGLIEKFGIMLSNTTGGWFSILEKKHIKKYDNSIDLHRKIILRRGELVKIGAPYTKVGSINPNDLLHVFFEHFFSLYGLYEGTFRARIQVQFLLINSVQNVYKNQGVEVSTKHIELIVKQMTSKVSIIFEKERLEKEYKNYNNILSVQKMFELQHLNYINNALLVTNKPIIIYKPTLLGVTKVASFTESFLAASSFQGTRSILIQAAIEGRIDWLRGLKENVILGNVLPAGSSFNNLIITESVKIKI